MFLTQSKYHRNSLGVGSAYECVSDEGLGLVVTQTTKFDPTKIRARFTHWLELAVNEMASQAREQIQSAGFDVDEAEGARNNFRQAAINSIPFNEMSGKIRTVVASWSTGTVLPKSPSAFATYGKMVMTAAISFVLPWVGISMMIFSMFGKKKKKKMAIPWNTLYAQAMPYAQDMTVQEELYRISQELQETKRVYVKEIEKVSRESALFKLPEYVLGIKRGALVMALKGGPVEKRL